MQFPAPGLNPQSRKATGPACQVCGRGVLTLQIYPTKGD